MYCICPPAYYGSRCQKPGCYHNGRTHEPGEVVSEDACKETVCRVVSNTTGVLVTSFKDYEGCAYEDQCVEVNTTLRNHHCHSCAHAVCRKDSSKSVPTFYFEVIQSGCSVNDRCYGDGDTIQIEGDCKKLVCRFNSVTKRYIMMDNYTGCSVNGLCYDEGQAIHSEGDCKKLVCQFDSETKEYTMIDNYAGCSFNGYCYADGDTVYFEGDYKELICQNDSETGRPSFIHNYTGCCQGGETVPAGTVTWSDACQQTVCVVSDNKSELVTSYIDYEGCTYRNQCVAENETIDGHIDNICVNLTCLRNTSQLTPTFDFDVIQNGCSFNGQCYYEGHALHAEGDCKKLVCQFEFESGEFVLREIYTGCHVNGRCYAEGDTIFFESECKHLKCRFIAEHGRYRLKSAYSGCYINGQCYKDGEKVHSVGDCKTLTCQFNKITEEFDFVISYVGCYNVTTNRCTYSDKENYTLIGCVKNVCDTDQKGKWKQSYLSARKCGPNQHGCITMTPWPVPGCRYNGKCYPVKSVISWNSCTQYTCYSDDIHLNNGSYIINTPAPKWKPRALGCYGPKGCMKFGEQYVDPNTLNTYRCDFNLRGLKHRFPTFHKACVMPNGRILALGQSVLINNAWYSCSRRGRIITEIDKIIEPREDDPVCGRNNFTGEIMYPGYPYFFEVGQCRMDSSCKRICDYFDEVCATEDPNQWRFIGDSFTQNDTECVCTQNHNVNNQMVNGADNPSLCGEKGVVGAACRDLDHSGVLRQWGELWGRPMTTRPEVVVICVCHPIYRTAFCSDYMPDVLNLRSSYI